MSAALGHPPAPASTFLAGAHPRPGGGRWDRPTGGRSSYPHSCSAPLSRADLDDCLRYGEQLAALRWLGGKAPLEQGRCRRLKAQELWRGGEWAEALKLQLQLVNSAAGAPADPAATTQLAAAARNACPQPLSRRQARRALGILSNLHTAHNASGTALGDQLERIGTARNFSKTGLHSSFPRSAGGKHWMP